LKNLGGSSNSADEDKANPWAHGPACALHRGRAWLIRSSMVAEVRWQWVSDRQTPLGLERGAVAGLVGIEGGVVSGVFNLESFGV
jgi:hypothetical protein